MANPQYGEASPERIADTNAMLAQLESLQAAPSAQYMPVWCAVEQRINSERAMGRFEEADRVAKCFRAISAGRRDPFYGTGRTYTMEECRKYQAARIAGLSHEHARAQLDTVTNIIIDSVFASQSIPVVRGADFGVPALQAAE